MSKAIYEKMINEAMAAQKADVGVIKAKRGTSFTISDAKPYVDAVNGMRAGEGQSKEVFDLHVQSVNAHYDILSSLTKTVSPEDDPFVEHYQTPPILEILYEADPAFKKSMDVFIEALSTNEALIGLETVRRYGGFYGPTCVVDFAFVPGSTSNLVNQILIGLNIPVEHKEAILSSKSWGMLTSYGLGAAFRAAVESGKTVAEAVKEEIETMRFLYKEPVNAQAKLMRDAHMTSFDCKAYMAQYKERMKPFILAAVKAGVHYGNIVTVPAYCVGDVAHHIGQSTYNMCKDDVTMAIIEAVTQVTENSLRSGLNIYQSPYDVLSVATGSGAAATAAILESDGFTTAMVIDLLVKRFYNYNQLYPNRGVAAELHNCDFMDMIHRGGKIIDPKPVGAACKVKGVTIDLEPLAKNEVLANPQRYTYAACAISVRFSSLMRLADYPCLLTSEPVTATLMTNVIALNPKVAGSPARTCKDCAVCSLVDRRQYCQWSKAV